MLSVLEKKKALAEIEDGRVGNTVSDLLLDRQTRPANMCIATSPLSPWPIRCVEKA